MAVGIQKAWSVVPASNASADANINWSEGQLGPTLNNSARAAMAAQKAAWNQLAGGCTYGGSANAYTITSDSVGAISTAYAAGMIFMLKANHTNNGAATLNVDGVGAVAIRTSDGGALASGDIVSGGLFLLAYETTVPSFQIIGTFAGGSFQPLDATITAIAALSFTGTDAFLRATGVDTFTAESATNHLTGLGLSANGKSLVTAADYAAMRTALSLVVGTNVQAFTQRLLEVGALAPGDGSFIVGDGSSFIVESGATVRTSLGLGTAAVKNTGTSGNNIPLLDGANTWSAAQTFNASAIVGDGTTSKSLTLKGASTGSAAGTLIVGNNGGSSAWAIANYSAIFGGAYDPDFIIYNAINDGKYYVALSGVKKEIVNVDNAVTMSNKTLASPTLSGTVAGSPTASGVWTFSATPKVSASAPGLYLSEVGAASDEKNWQWIATGGDLYLQARNDADSGATNFLRITRTGLTIDSVILASTAFTWNGNQVLTTATGALLSGATFTGAVNIHGARTKLRANNEVFSLALEYGSGLGQYYLGASNAASPDLIFSNVGGAERGRLTDAGLFTPITIQAAVAVSSETTGTLTAASRNTQVNASGDPTINDGVFTAGDRIEIYAGASARSIVQDTGMTLRLDGTATTGSRSLAARGRAALYFVSNSEAIVSGMGVS